MVVPTQAQFKFTLPNHSPTIVETDFDNQLIDQFEDEIKSGKLPDIDSYLAHWPEDSQPRILLELIAIEVFHRVMKGRSVSNQDYARFGEKAGSHAKRVRDQLSI